MLSQILSNLCARPRRHAHVILLARRSRDAVDRSRMSERLVLRRQGRRRDVRDHEAGFHSRLAGQKHIERGIDAAIEQVRATFRHAGELCYGDAEEVADEPERRGVEVATGENLLAEDERVV